MPGAVLDSVGRERQSLGRRPRSQTPMGEWLVPDRKLRWPAGWTARPADAAAVAVRRPPHKRRGGWGSAGNRSWGTFVAGKLGAFTPDGSLIRSWTAPVGQFALNCPAQYLLVLLLPLRHIGGGGEAGQGGHDHRLHSGEAQL